MSAPVRVIPLSGFGAAGEPEIRIMSDGSLRVVFNFMPPSDVEDDGEDGMGGFGDFDKRMALAVGVAVKWDDREVFVIERPAADTVERVRHFIEGHRRNTG
jgi:hypothetical protein